MKRFQAVTALLCAVVLAVPLSLRAESRTPQRTDMRALAAELAAVLGRGAVERRPAERQVPRSNIQALVDEMNRYRTAAGLGALQLDRRLSLAAGDRISDMFSRGYFDHVAPWWGACC